MAQCGLPITRLTAAGMHQGSEHRIKNGTGDETVCTVEHLLVAPMKRDREYSVLVSLDACISLGQAGAMFPGFIVSEVRHPYDQHGAVNVPRCLPLCLATSTMLSSEYQ